MTLVKLILKNYSLLYYPVLCRGDLEVVHNAQHVIKIITLHLVLSKCVVALYERFTEWDALLCAGMRSWSCEKEEMNELNMSLKLSLHI